jgi:hypothetical protein
MFGATSSPTSSCESSRCRTKKPRRPSTYERACSTSSSCSSVIGSDVPIDRTVRPLREREHRLDVRGGLCALRRVVRRRRLLHVHDRRLRRRRGRDEVEDLDRPQRLRHDVAGARRLRRPAGRRLEQRRLDLVAVEVELGHRAVPWLPRWWPVYAFDSTNMLAERLRLRLPLAARAADVAGMRAELAELVGVLPCFAVDLGVLLLERLASFASSVSSSFSAADVRDLRGRVALDHGDLRHVVVGAGLLEDLVQLRAALVDLAAQLLQLAVIVRSSPSEGGAQPLEPRPLAQSGVRVLVGIRVREQLGKRLVRLASEASRRGELVALGRGEAAPVAELGKRARPVDEPVARVTRGGRFVGKRKAAQGGLGASVGRARRPVVVGGERGASLRAMLAADHPRTVASNVSTRSTIPPASAFFAVTMRPSPKPLTGRRRR